MADLGTNSYRPYLYIDLDFIMMDFFKHFRVKHYTKIIVNDIHPLDVNYENIVENKNIRSFFIETIQECNLKFWLTMPVSNVGNFYWKRLKKYQDQIFFITNCTNKEELEFKKLWIQSNLLTYKDILLDNIDISEYSRSRFYQNILISNDISRCKKWSDTGGIALWDLNKRSVASYYLEKNILKHFDTYPGIDLVAGIPDIRASRKKNLKDFDIKSIDDYDLFDI